MARRGVEERESVLFAERVIARRKAEREERRSLEKEQVERTTGGKEERELLAATYSVASVSGSLPVIDEVELARDEYRRKGAISKRLVSRGREERNPRPSPVNSPASPDGNRGREGGATSEEERRSRAVERELRDYLSTGPAKPLGEEPPRRPPPPLPSAPRRLARQVPEGRERAVRPADDSGDSRAHRPRADGVERGEPDSHGCDCGRRVNRRVASVRAPTRWREEEEEEEELEPVQPPATLGGGRLRLTAADAPEITVASRLVELCSSGNVERRAVRERVRVREGRE